MANQRIYAFDGLRAFAMMMGIPFHVALCYSVVAHEDLWVLQDRNNHLLFDYFCFFIRYWRMPLFFLMSGFLAQLVWNKNSKGFLTKRFKRLVLPLFLLAPFILGPLKVFWILGTKPGLLYQGSFQEIIQYIILHFNDALGNETFREKYTWGHMWFLMYLSLLSVLTPFWNKIKIFDSRTKIAMCIGGVFLAHLSWHGHWPPPSFAMIPKWQFLLYYGCFYSIGHHLFFYRNTLKTKLLTSSPKTSLIGIGALFGLFSFFRSFYQIQVVKFGGGIPLVSQLTMGVTTFFGIYFFLKLGFLVFRRGQSFVQYIVEASYYYYLAHMPLVALFAVILYPLDISPLPKFILHNTLVFMLLGVTYQYLVKDRAMGRFLAGKYSLPKFNLPGRSRFEPAKVADKVQTVE